MRLQHRHPRSCFSPSSHNNYNILSSIQQFPLSALLSIYIQRQFLDHPNQSFTHRQHIPICPPIPDIDIKKTVRHRFSVSLLFIRSRFFSPSSFLHLSISFFSKSSVMGRVCFDKMQSSRPRADFLLGWIQLNQPVPDHPSVSIRDRQQSF